MSSQHILAVRPVRITKDRRVEYLSTEEMIDLFKRLTTVPAEYSGLLFLIDFTRPYDSEYFKQFVSPAEAYQGLIDWSAEGLPDPGTGSLKVAKIGVEAGQTIYITVPVTIPVGKTAVCIAVLYTKSDYIKYRIYAKVGARVLNAIPFVGKPEVTSAWSSIFTIGFIPVHRPSKCNYVIEIKNEGTTTDYCYIALILVSVLEKTMDETVAWIGWGNAIYEVTNTTETLVFDVFKPAEEIVCKFVVRMESDGTNELTVDFQLVSRKYGTSTVVSFSRTATGYTTYTFTFGHVGILIEDKHMEYKVAISTAGVGRISYCYVRFTVAKPAVENKSVRGSYTTAGTGEVETVTVLDYTTAVKYARVKRVKVTVTSGTAVLLKAIVDGNDYWDFKNDGSELTIELNDVRKLEIQVQDDGTASVTISYSVQIEEIGAFLAR